LQEADMVSSVVSVPMPSKPSFDTMNRIVPGLDTIPPVVANPLPDGYDTDTTEGTETRPPSLSLSSELTNGDARVLAQKLLKVFRAAEQDGLPYLTPPTIQYKAGESVDRIEQVLRRMQKDGLLFQPHKGAWGLVKP